MKIEVEMIFNDKLYAIENLMPATISSLNSKIINHKKQEPIEEGTRDICYFVLCLPKDALVVNCLSVCTLILL